MIPFSVVEVDVRNILKRYAASCRTDCLDKRLRADLALGNREFSAFITELESAMRLKLRGWLQDTSKAPVSPPLWKRLLGAKEEPFLRDVTVRELCEHVCTERRIRSDSEDVEGRRLYGPPRHD